MLVARKASAAAVLWGIRVRKGLVRNKTGHEDENRKARHPSWAAQDRLLHLGRAGQELTCLPRCAVVAVTVCGWCAVEDFSIRQRRWYRWMLHR